MSVEADFFRGDLVRLTAEDAEILGKTYSQWHRDSELYRLMDIDPVMVWSQKKIQAWIETDLEKDEPRGYFFYIRALEDDRLIGDIGLGGVQRNHGEAWVGMGIGEREYWGKGYGTDAMRLVLRYAFTELNLHRVTLGVYVYNQRAIRSYEKAGFIVEGRERGSVRKDGSRFDSLVMGILRSEWEQLQNGQ